MKDVPGSQLGSIGYEDCEIVQGQLVIRLGDGICQLYLMFFRRV